MSLDVSTRYAPSGAPPFRHFSLPLPALHRLASQLRREPLHPEPPLEEKRVDTLNSFCYSPCSPFLWDSGLNPRWLQNAHLQSPSSAFDKESCPALARLNIT
jgi:hypothetical protein